MQPGVTLVYQKAEGGELRLAAHVTGCSASLIYICLRSTSIQQVANTASQLHLRFQSGRGHEEECGRHDVTRWLYKAAME